MKCGAAPPVALIRHAATPPNGSAATFAVALAVIAFQRSRRFEFVIRFWVGSAARALTGFRRPDCATGSYLADVVRWYGPGQDARTSWPPHKYTVKVPFDVESSQSAQSELYPMFCDGPPLSNRVHVVVAVNGVKIRLL